MELPTYTNIWRIEKRLYKLYDFRLPMPVPVGQVAAFLAIAIPYIVVLTMAGMPFSHTWVWLYVLPPGVLAWLVTRPVIEGKRLPELVVSQLRYLSEPRTWCRMAPLAERDQMFVTAKVWRRSALIAPVMMSDRDQAEGASADAVWLPDAAEAEPALAEVTLAVPDAVLAEPQPESAAPIRPVWPTRPAIASRSSLAPSSGAAAEPAEQTPLRATATAPAGSLARLEPAAAVQAPPSQAAATKAVAAQSPAAQTPPAQTQARAALMPTGQAATSDLAAAKSNPSPPWPPGRPAVRVRSDSSPARPLPVVERALRTSPSDRTDGWRERVVVVPGGHRPGKPDQVQRDQARARFPLPGPARIVVLGCTAGAGQTTTTLVTGQLLATLRSEAVAVLDIGSGPGSLTEQARQIPRLLPSHRDAAGTPPGSGRARGLQVVTADPPADQPADAGKLIDAVVARYRITIADPAAAHVPRAVHVADQLVLVAPASADAAGSLAMTLEWLEAHGHSDLARGAVTVLNGVSAATASHVDKAAGVATGRCRAIVRVPWDHTLAAGGALGTPAFQAFTALAGVLIAGLAKPASAHSASAHGGSR